MELKGLRESSSGQSGVGEEGRSGSQGALAGQIVWFVDGCGRSESLFHSDVQSHLFVLTLHNLLSNCLDKYLA